MDQEKIAFIKEGFVLKIKTLTPDSMALWGKMNAQQMVEHVTGFFKVSTNEIHFPLVTPEEHLPRYREFLFSDKQFRENTIAPVLPEDPLPLTEPDLTTAINKLSGTIQQFFDFFDADTSVKTVHSVFGPLNFEEWVLLHHKHITHHARQFGLLPRL